MLTAVQTQQSGVRHDIKRPRQTLPVYPSLPWRRFLASRGTTRSWHLFLSIQCFAKWLTIQWIWGGRIASCWGSSNILSVVFMHLSMWGHAMMSGVNWGYEGISEHCWWCIIPEPSHIKGEPPPPWIYSLSATSMRHLFLCELFDMDLELSHRSLRSWQRKLRSLNR